MKTLHVFFLTLLTSWFFISCSENEDEVKGKFDGKPIVFTTAISSHTRVSDSQWENADAIGVYMKTNGQTLSTTSALASNKKHTTATAQGDFVFATDADKIFFPEDGSNVDFIAYYPYKTAIADFKYPVNLAGDQTGKIPELDLLYSNDQTNKNNTATAVNLKFHHKLSIIQLNITDLGAKDLTGIIVKISGTTTASSFSLADGTFTDTPSSVADIVAETTATNNTATSKAIILPVDALNGAKISFNIPSHGNTYTWDIPAGQKYESGNRYKYEVEVNSATGQIVVNLSSNIEGWDDNDEPKIEIGKENPAGGDGTENSPYTINQLSAKIGETGKWVEGYIVGSTAKTRSFGTPSTENILIAATADETDETKCIPVDISSSAVKANLDITVNSSLIGKKVKLQGDVVNDIFGGTLSLTNIIAQVGGANPAPGPQLVFPGSDFEDWSAFTGCLSTSLKTKYAAQNNTEGRNGTSALHLNGTPTGNDYVFTAQLASNITTSPTKIVFYIKGTSAKSLSINIYRANGTNYDVFNLGTYSTEAVITKAKLNSNQNGTNDYGGEINTGGEWIKVTLDITDDDLSKTKEKDIFALKVGKDVVYDLLIDDITFEFD